MWRAAIILAVLLPAVSAPAVAEVAVRVHYLKVEIAPPPTLTDLAEPIADEGMAGAALGLQDNATTGLFLNHAYALETTVVPAGGNVAAAARAALATTDLLILDAPAAAVLAVADLPEASEALILNAGAEDMALRSAECRANVLHTAPSLAMRTDALMQFLVTRRWGDLALIAGPHPEDLAFAAALHASAAKFGLKIAAEKTWGLGPDLRRNAAAEVPLFTQDLPRHDVLLIADAFSDFGPFVMFNTWTPVPLAGTEGLTPVAWSPVQEQWGAAQLQNRFQVGAAYRPQFATQFDLLLRYEQKREYNNELEQRESRNVNIVSTHLNWHPSRTVWMSGRVAAKDLDENFGSVRDDYQAWLVSGRVIKDIGERLDVSAIAGVTGTPDSKAREKVYGLELGYRVKDNMWLSAGHNFAGFSDRDLVGREQTEEGWYLRLRMKFDEKTLKGLSD